MDSNQILLKLKEQCSLYEEGDLLILADIQEILEKLKEEEWHESFSAAINLFLKLLDSLENLPDTVEFITAISRFSDLADKVPDNFEEMLAALTEPFLSYTVEPPEPPDTTYDNFIQERGMLEKFFDEASEHLTGAQVVLVDLEYDTHNQDIINTIFRAFHTIKGSAAFLGIKNIEDVAHEIEDMLSLVRGGKLIVSGKLIDIIFYGIKFIEDLIRIIPACDYNVERIITNYKSIEISQLVQLIQKVVKEYSFKKIGEILEDMGKIDGELVDQILTKQSDDGKKFGEILVEEEIVSQSDVGQAMKIQNQQKVQSSFVKVQSDKLNDLVDMVGELVVIQSILKESALEDGNSSLNRNLMQLNSISRGIKNIVLNMGMVPISEIFNRLKVVIRNAGRDLGRIINVTFSGEDTEVDRNLIEAIYDPLVHMARNSADHGIEDPEERISRGKTDVGHIHISASHKGNGIEVCIEDDGKGIDPVHVVDKAIEKEVISEDMRHRYLESPKDAYMLLFEPGFSTKSVVSELSGRGVGLDVVKKNIEEVRGKIDIQSSVGLGSRFTLRLPLTLAIIEGFVTLVEGQKYIFPFVSIAEIIVPEGDQLQKMDGGEIILNNRGRFIPVFQANKIIRIPAGATRVESEENSLGVVLIINHDGEQYGIGVDRVLGKQEIVIKNLNEVLQEMEIFSGGSIFGDGSIGFVVDIDIFLDLCN